MPRLFTGIEIPDELRRLLAQLRGGLQGARWADPDDYHLTLRFVGDAGFTFQVRHRVERRMPRLVF